jgi:ATP-binding cassette subfamily B protein
LVVLVHGTVADLGSHDDLLERSPLYREIVEKGMPDQVFINRKPLEAQVAGL